MGEGYSWKIARNRCHVINYSTFYVAIKSGLIPLLICKYGNIYDWIPVKCRRAFALILLCVWPSHATLSLNGRPQFNLRVITFLSEALNFFISIRSRIILAQRDLCNLGKSFNFQTAAISLLASLLQSTVEKLTGQSWPNPIYTVPNDFSQ